MRSDTGAEPTAIIVAIAENTAVQEAAPGRIISGTLTSVYHARRILSGNTTVLKMITPSMKVGLALFAGASLSIACVWWIHRPSVSGDLTSCLNGGSCENILVRSDSHVLAAGDLQLIAKPPPISQAAKLVRRCYTVLAPDHRQHLILTATINGEEQAFHVLMFDSSDGEGIFLGSLITKLLTIKELTTNPAIKTLGPLYRAVSNDTIQIEPVLESAGVRRIDISGTETVPVADISSSFIKLAGFNETLPIKVLRP